MRRKPRVCQHCKDDPTFCPKCHGALGGCEHCNYTGLCPMCQKTGVIVKGQPK